MSNTRALDFGWLFLRLAIGLRFLEIGADAFSSRNLTFFAVAALIFGVFLIVGLLVRPAAILMLLLLISVFVQGSSLSIRLVRESFIELLALVGFLIGGGGSFFVFGAAIQGLKGKWYQ